MSSRSRITAYLEKSNDAFFVAFSVIAAFCTYSCMYAMRKPIAAATFSGLTAWEMDYKILLLIMQVIGYALSKFIGIKIVSEATKDRRAMMIVLTIGVAGIALLLFALIPPPYNVIMLFFNGIPLGLVWGLVFSYLEGRKYTEILGAGLSISFIFSSGFVKSVGKLLMLNYGVSEFWMPFLTGAIFFIPLVISVWLLNQIPEPDEKDIEFRTKREPMTSEMRREFFKKFSAGLIFLIISYTALTVIRDFRDNFAADIWKAVGFGNSSDIFTLTEIPVSIFILIMIGSLFLIKNNFNALIISHYFVIGGAIASFIATLLFQQNYISAPVWMIVVGAGLYLGYVPFNSMFFDRMIATFKYVSNVGFLIYLVDSFGYLGSTLMMLFKNFFYSKLDWLNFFEYSVYFGSITIIIFTFLSSRYFTNKYKEFEYDAKLVQD